MLHEDTFEGQKTEKSLSKNSKNNQKIGPNRNFLNFITNCEQKKLLFKKSPQKTAKSFKK